MRNAGLIATCRRGGYFNGLSRTATALAMLAATLVLAGCWRSEFVPSPPELKGSDAYVKGAMAYQEGDRERAIAALRAALQENPDLIMARFLLGNIHKDTGDYAAAAEQYEKVVELDPYVYSNHYNLGLMYHLLNKLQEAAKSYLNSLRLNPTDMKSNMNLGMVYTALGNPELGLTYVQRAAEIDPKSAEAQANLAVVQDTLQNYSAAERAYRRAMELDPNRSETAVNLAGCLVAQKRYADAITVYSEVLKTADSSLLRQRYGHALLLAGKFEEAIKQFTEAIRLNSKNYQAANGIGDALIGQYRQSSMLDETKRAAAVKFWRKSLELNPNQPRVTALVTEYSQASLFP